MELSSLSLHGCTAPPFKELHSTKRWVESSLNSDKYLCLLSCSCQDVHAAEFRDGKMTMSTFMLDCVQISLGQQGCLGEASNPPNLRICYCKHYCTASNPLTNVPDANWNQHVYQCMSTCSNLTTNAQQKELTIFHLNKRPACWRPIFSLKDLLQPSTNQAFDVSCTYTQMHQVGDTETMTHMHQATYLITYPAQSHILPLDVDMTYQSL